ncbi:uncharacterized protein LOC143301358 [Babylonia areolata]|uniref:uncharacterized protein LOC143301358 n=1 Tax=Babylonia areolata TaxID=304850 RepID=UPI003FCF0BC6
MPPSSWPSDVSTNSQGRQDVVTSVRVMTTAVDDGVGEGSVEGNLADVEEFLLQKDDEFALAVLPAIIYLGLILVLGVIGNVTVLYVFNRKIKRGAFRWFVQALAVFNLLSCTLGLTGEMTDMRRNYTFGSSPLCPVFRTVNYFCIQMSASLLVVVAVDIYRKTCHAQERQITPKDTKIPIAICTALATLFSAPATVLYGSQTALTDNPAINGSDCSFKDAFKDTIYPLAFHGLHILVFLTATVILIVLYSMIGRKVWAQERSRKSGFGVMSWKMFVSRNSNNLTTDASNKNASAAGRESNAFAEVKEKNAPTEGKENNVLIETMEMVSKASTEVKESEHNMPKKQTPNVSVSPETRRLTRMAFLVTLVFILSYLPCMSMLIVKSLSQESLFHLNLAVQNILLRSYFINSMANPVIYILCLGTFRQECLKILCCHCLRKKQTRH